MARHTAPKLSLFRTRPRRALNYQLPPSHSFHTTAFHPQPRSPPAAQRVYLPCSKIDADKPPEPVFPHNFTASDQDYSRNASEQERADFKEAYDDLEKAFNDPDTSRDK